MRLVSKLFLALALCSVAFSANAQTSIRYKILSPSPLGFAPQNSYYTGSNPDSVFAVLESSGNIGSSPVYQADELKVAPDGQVNIVATYQQTANVLLAYKNAYSFNAGSGLGPLFHYSVLVNLIDTALTAIGTPSAGTFVVTGVIVRGNNDTTGYTSNATVKVGTATAPGTPYANIVATATPSPGGLGTITATLVSPRNDVPSGTTIYAHVTTAAVATTETCYVDVWGYYR